MQSLTMVGICSKLDTAMFFAPVSRSVFPATLFLRCSVRQSHYFSEQPKNVQICSNMQCLLIDNSSIHCFMIEAASPGAVFDPTMLVNDTTQEIADGAFLIAPRTLFFMLKNLSCNTKGIHGNINGRQGLGYFCCPLKQKITWLQSGNSSSCLFCKRTCLHLIA